MTRPIQPELAFDAKPHARPRQIVTESSLEFQNVWERAQRGEFVIERVAMGKGNAQWVFGVRYNT